MKNLMSQCPEELVEVICEAYPDYWPLTREQICYFLFRKARAGDSAPMSIMDTMGRSFPYNMYLRKFLDRGLDGSPFPTENLRSECSTESDFGPRRDESRLELWVDDTALAEFLRFHSKKFTGIPVYDAGRLQSILAAREVKDRFARMQKNKDRLPVVLFLADLDAAGHRGYEALTDLFGEYAHFDRVGINVEHASGLLSKPAILCDDRELKEDGFFATELSLPGCYSLSALEPPALIEMVRNAVDLHRMWEGFHCESTAGLNRDGGR
jgi:hypothetical protein